MINSKIEWTDHTFNPWWGCEKVSQGCKNCYAEALDKRWQGGHWGPGSSRRPMSAQYWRQPLNWNKAAGIQGVTEKVFCASMADVFEGHPETIRHLNLLFDLIACTPNLIWQLLTKRPENILKLVPEKWITRWPKNVWIGTSVENQEAAETRIPILLGVPAKVRFLSCEPLLGDLDIMYPKGIWPDGPETCCSGRECGCMGQPTEPPLVHGIHWVIAGGESGHGARPCHPTWIRGLRNQCQSAGVAFFFKQYGDWLPVIENVHRLNNIPDPERMAVKSQWLNFDGGQGFHGEMVCMVSKCGKKKAGRLLDGIEHNAFPICDERN